MLDESATQAVRLAQQDAYDRHLGYVGSESLVVGILVEAQQRRATHAPWGVSIERVRAAVAKRVGSSPPPNAQTPHFPPTPQAARAILAEQQRLGIREPWETTAQRMRAEGRGSILEPITEPARIPLTPQAAKVLKHADQQSQATGRNVTPEDILLTLIDGGQGIGFEALAEACAPAPIDGLRKTLQRSLED